MQMNYATPPNSDFRLNKIIKNFNIGHFDKMCSIFIKIHLIAQNESESPYTQTKGPSRLKFIF